MERSPDNAAEYLRASNTLYIKIPHDFDSKSANVDMLSDDVMWILEHLNVISVDPLTSVSEHRGVWDSLDFFDIIDGGIARCMIERIYSARRGIDCTITWYTDEEIARARTVAGVDL